MNARGGWIALFLLTSACAADMTEAWEVTEPRLMGARVEVEGDPARPRPKLGERFDIRQYLALPGPLETPLSMRYDIDAALCLGFRSPTGKLTCLGEQELSPALVALSDTEILFTGLALDVDALLRSIGEADLPTFQAGADAGTVDPMTALGELDRLALFGALCVEGKVERVPNTSVRDDPASQLFRCIDNEGARFPQVSSFTLSVLLDRGRPFDPNQNPSLACDERAPESPCVTGRSLVEGEAKVPGSIVLALPARDGTDAREVVPWLATDPQSHPTWADCAGDTNLPQVAVGSENYEVRVRFDPSDREPYQYEISSNGEPVLQSDREALQLSAALSTGGGKLERHFSHIDGDRADADAEIRFDYEPLDDHDDEAGAIPPGGRLVRFYFTLRDERGGVDFATRDLCLVASE